MRRADRTRFSAGFAGLAAVAAVGVLGAAFATPARAERVFTGPGLAQRQAQPGALNAFDIQNRVGFDQKLGATLPLDLPFVDEAGRTVRLGETFHGRPVVLAPVYFRCPVLCSQVGIGVAAAMKALTFTAGREFEVVFVSFDPTDRPDAAAEKKAATLARYGDPSIAPGVHFLSAPADSPESAARLMEAIGFRYAYDETTRQYAHAAGIVVATADGRVSRYLYGVEYAPKDLKLALYEAGEGEIGGLAEKLMLLCFNYDAALGKYTAVTMLSLKAAATVTLAALVGAILWMLRAERRGRKKLRGQDSNRGGGAPLQGAASV